MIQKFNNFKVNTNGQKLYEFTDETINWIKKNKFKNGILNLSIQHTSASLIIQENADPDVQTDLLNYFNKLVPMDNNLYIHTTEGKAAMPAHIKTILIGNAVQIPVKKGKMSLGIWQGIYFCEHRNKSTNRKVVITINY